MRELSSFDQSEDNSQQLSSHLYATNHALYKSTAFVFWQLDSYMNLGPHFSNSPCIKKFKITNNGRRLQQLVWTTDGFPLVKPRKDPLYDARDIKFKV